MDIVPNVRKRKNPRMKGILLANNKLKENATAQIAHLVFFPTRKTPTRKNQKSYFLANV
jgi:hypothetical protein